MEVVAVPKSPTESRSDSMTSHTASGPTAEITCLVASFFVPLGIYETLLETSFAPQLIAPSRSSIAPSDRPFEYKLDRRFPAVYIELRNIYL
ncbi:hypothetical protein OROMI_032119 [Orobanche minor]